VVVGSRYYLVGMYVCMHVIIYFVYFAGSGLVFCFVFLFVVAVRKVAAWNLQLGTGGEKTIESTGLKVFVEKKERKKA